MATAPEYAYGILCHAHFEQRDPRPLKTECDTCSDCLAARQADRDRIQRHHTIDSTRPYGEHITLTCKNHTDLRWSTKNIDYIGARSIFFAPGSGVECACSANDLVVL